MPSTGAVDAHRRRAARVALAAASVLLLWALALPSSASATHRLQMTEASGTSDSGSPDLATYTSATRVYYDRQPNVRFHYRVRHEQSVDLTIKLVRAADGRTVRTWTRTVEDGGTDSVSWNGTVEGDLQGERKYQFRATARDSRSGATTTSADASDTSRDAFNFHHNRFPIRGPHNYGSSGSTFGAPRSGHSHQGQDVFASCGTRLDLARGGKVQYAGYQSSAGHYLVVDGQKTGVDYVYMHLRQAPSVDTGDYVDTGQTVGAVGDSGNASGCHLHFEMWGSPGWYEGGDPFDPLPSLKRWDSYS